MVMLILKQFASYTLDDLLEQPYYYILKLFNMAEKAEALNAHTVLYGNAGLHDSKVSENISSVYNMKFVQPKIEFPKHQ